MNTLEKDIYKKKINKSYYLTLNDEVIDVDKLFKKENIFKGKIGIFEIKNNKINHKLNLYKIENGELKKIF